MVKQYIKQAIGTLKETPLTSTISILGTALSVAMILVIVLQFQIRLTGYKPVSERSRMLYLSGTKSMSKDGKDGNNTSLSAEVIRECFYSLKTPEAVTALTQNKFVVSLPGKRNFDEYAVTYTDPHFWQIFDFRFHNGKAFTKADFESGLPRAIISDYLASRLFGTLDVVGREVTLNGVVNYTITGVVERPSKAADETYADLWVPYTSNSALVNSWGCEGTCGSFRAIILAHHPSDFEAIKAELLHEQARYNAMKSDYTITLFEAFSRLEITLGSSSWPGGHRVGWLEYLRGTGLILLFLLLVPTLNLTGVIQSSIQKRRSEMGLRKAFGATNGKLFTQLVSENLVITFIGGTIGIVLSVLLLFLCKSFLLTRETQITLDMLFQPLLFVAAFFFTLLINLLSSGLPAYRLVRESIVQALKDEYK